MADPISSPTTSAATASTEQASLLNNFYTGITTYDWLILAAIILGPVIAVQLTRYLDDKKEIRQRKLQVFKTLMTTRSYTVSWDHVMTLNRIDLEFDARDRKEKEVIEAWKAYHDLLSDSAMPPEQWAVKRSDLLIELLHKMAIVLNYDFDKTHIKNSSYSPIAHGEEEDNQKAIRKGIIEVLEGERDLPLRITNWEEQAEIISKFLQPPSPDAKNQETFEQEK